MTHVQIDPIRQTIHRAWNDISRKLLAVAATGLTSTGVVTGLAFIGIHIPEPLAALLVVIVSSIAGYLVAEKVQVGTVTDIATAAVDAVTAPPITIRSGLTTDEEQAALAADLARGTRVSGGRIVNLGAVEAEPTVVVFDDGAIGVRHDTAHRD